MFKRIRKPITNRQLNAIVQIVKKTKKLTAIIAMLGIIWSSGPMQFLNAMAPQDFENVIIDTNDIEEVSNLLSQYPTTTDSDFDPSQVEIDSEVESERTETSKTFRKIDGTYEVAMYNDVIHYLEDGKYNQVDNSFFDLGTELENKANKFKLKLPKKLDDNKKIKLSMDGYSIDWSILDIDSSAVEYDESEITPNNIKELVNINQTVFYRNIQQHVDIEYIITGSKIKENIILNQYVEDFSMTFEYKLKDLELITAENGEIVFVNDNNDVIFVFSDLFMLDNEMNESFDIDFTYVKTGNKRYEITITPSDEWLENAVYPVKVDPSLEIKPEDGFIQDLYANSSVVNDTSSVLAVGSVSSNAYRSYLEIDLDLLDSSLNRNLTYAFLRLNSYGNSNYCDATCQINIREVKSHITFSSIINANDDNLDNQGILDDVEDRIIDYNWVNSSDAMNKMYSWDITTLIQKWNFDGDTSGIIEMRAETDVTGDYVLFDSANNYSGVKPVIEIGYIDTAGIKDYWTYSQYSAGQAGTGFVSDYTGNLTLVRNDLDFSTERQSLNLSFSFDTTNKNVDLGYGLGWRTNYNIFITEIEENEEYMITDNTGNQVHYYPATCDSRVADSYPIYNDCYVAEDGSGNIYVRATLDDEVHKYFYEHYILTMDQIGYYFGSDAHLDYIKNNKTNQQILISREATDKNLIKKVQDQVGNKIDFSYDNGLLEYTTLSLKQQDLSFNVVEKVEYFYDSTIVTGKSVLDEVKFYRNYDTTSSLTLDETVEYTYKTDGKLESALIQEQEKKQFSYTGDKVYSVISYSNGRNFGAVSYNYQFGKTTITDLENNYVIYKFDSFGHTVNLLDKFGNTQFFSYLNLFKYNLDTGTVGEQIADILFTNMQPNYMNNHKLISKSDPMKTINNPVINHSFEMTNTITCGKRWDLYTDGIYKDGSQISLPICTTDESLYGARSALLDYSSANGYKELRQDVELKDGFYTMIVYAKNESDGNDALIEVNIDRSGVIETFTSDNIPNDGEWNEVRVQFDTDADFEDVTISLKNGNGGKVYFDNVQIIEGFRDTRINQLDDSSFELSTPSSSGWVISDPDVSLIDNDSITTSLEQDILGSKSIEIVGNPNEINNAWTSVTDFMSYGYADGTIVVGGWAYSEGTPTSMEIFGPQNEFSTDDIDRVFRISVKVYDSEPGVGYVLLEEHYIDFDATVQGWQYVLEEVKLDTDVEWLEISLDYQGEGKVYFDSIQVYFEEMSTEYEYDSNGHVVSVTDSSNVKTSFEYDNPKDSRPTRILHGENDVIELAIADEESFVSEIIYNNVKSFPTKNSYRQTTQIVIGDTAAMYFTTSTSYLSSGFSQYVQSKTNEFGKTTTNYHDTLTGLLTAIENSKGNELYYDYDNEGKLIKVVSLKDHNNQSANVYGQVEYEYDSQDRLKYIIMERNELDEMTYYYEILYDTENRIDEVKVNSQRLMKYTYEKEGSVFTNRMDTQEYGNGDKWEFEYTDEGQTSEVWFGNSGEATIKRFGYEYDQSGNLAVFNTFEYDSQTQEYTVVSSEHYTYDSSGRVKKVVDNEGDSFEFGYSEDGNLSALILEINGDETTTYFNHNKCLEYSGETCVTESSLYDNTAYETLSGIDVVRDYNYEKTALLRLDYINLVTGTTNLYKQDYVFDGDTTRIKEIQYTITSSTSVDFKYKYTYDSLGNITAVYYYEGGSVKKSAAYEYDEMNQLIMEKVSDFDAESTQLTDTNYRKYYYYDDRGNITDVKTFLVYQNEYFTGEDISTVLQNYGRESADVYHSNGLHYTIPVQLNVGETFDPLTDMDYTFVEATEQIDITNYVSNQYCNSNVNTSIENNYYVNCEVSDDYGDFLFFFRIEIIVGNPISGPVTPQEHIHYNYDATWLDQMTSYGTIDYVNGVAQTEVAVQEYTYDSQGNPTGITNFVYEGVEYHHAVLEYDGRQLRKIEVHNDNSGTNIHMTISYKYNDQGYRVEKSIDDGINVQTITYKLNGDKVYYETDGTYGIIYTYGQDGAIISFNYDSNISDSVDGVDYFYLRNQQGDITKILDKDGNIELEYEYDAWGNIINWEDINTNPLATINQYTYRGYRYDSEISMYYLNSRFYNPTVGRFLNADGLVGARGSILSNNMYSYTANNPINYLDSSGESWIIIAIIVLAVILIETLLIVEVVDTGEPLAPNSSKEADFFIGAERDAEHYKVGIFTSYETDVYKDRPTENLTLEALGYKVGGMLGYDSSSENPSGLIAQFELMFGEATLAQEIFSIGKFDVSFSANAQAGIGAHVGAIYDSNGLHLGSGAAALVGFSWNLSVKYDFGGE